MKFSVYAGIALFLLGCGSAERRPMLAACPEGCPDEFCDEATGACLLPIPDTLITERPAALSTSRDATFTFTSSLPGATFVCELDGAIVTCDATQTFTVTDGPHRLVVTAMLGAMADPTPEIYEWTVDAGAPVVTIRAPGEGAMVEPDVLFDFGADDPAPTWSCTLDDGPVDSCAPGLVIAGLASGPHTFRVVATDAAGNASAPAEVTFTVNRAPTIGTLAAITTAEDTATGNLPFTIGDADTPLGNLTVTATSSALTLIPPSGIVLGGSAGARTLRVVPAANQNGSAEITVRVSDGFATRTLVVPVTVTPVNDAPTVSDVGNQVVAEDGVTAAIPFFVGDVETPPASLTVTATSSSTTILPAAGITMGGSGGNRTVTLRPAANQTGPVTITLRVSDGVTTTTDTFVLTVGSADDPPTISDIGAQTTAEDTGVTVSFTVGDIDTALTSLTLSASSNQPSLIGSVTFGGSGASRTATVTPAANLSGSVTVQITVSDATSSAADSFALTITPVNDPPVLTAPGTQTINEDGTTGSVGFTATDIDSPPPTVTATATSNGTLLPLANVSVDSPGRTVRATPAANQNGSTTVTLQASDGAGGTDTETFTVTVNAVNDRPTISAPVNPLAILEDGTRTYNFTVGDIDTPLANLVVTGTSSNTTVIPNAAIVEGGTTAARTVQITPAANQNSTAAITITLSVSDGSLTAPATFTLTVTPQNDAPTIGAISNFDDLGPNGSTGTINVTLGDVDGDTPLTLTASSSNASFPVTVNSAARTLVVAPTAGTGGETTVTATVTDPSGATGQTTFRVRARVRLTGAVAGSGAGTVVATGTDCAGNTSTCDRHPGTGSVTFVATPSPGAIFTGWSGSCNSSGVISPIPTSWATCTASFRGMWARTYVRQDISVDGRGLAAGGGMIHMLGQEAVPGATSTALVWTADPTTGAPRDARRLTVDTLPLTPTALISDPSAPEQSVLLSNAPTSNGITVTYLDATNARRVAYALSTGGQVRDTPYAIAPNPATRGVTIAGTSHNESPVAVFPFYTRVYRLPAAPAGQSVLPQVTQFCEYNAIGTGCSRGSCRGLSPIGLAVTASGRTLVASMAAPFDGQQLQTNLTILHADGSIESAQHVETDGGGSLLIPYAAVARGEEFYVAGLVQEARGGTYDSFVMRLRSDGSIIFVRRFGRADLNDAAGQLRPTSAGVAVTGWTTASTVDVFAVEISTAGTMVRGMRHGGPGNDFGFYLEPAPTGGWYALGSTAGSFGNAVNAPWGLELDAGFALRFNAASGGASASFAPATVAVTVTATPVCTEASVGEISYGTAPFSSTNVTLSGTVQAP